MAEFLERADMCLVPVAAQSAIDCDVMFVELPREDSLRPVCHSFST